MGGGPSAASDPGEANGGTLLALILLPAHPPSPIDEVRAWSLTPAERLERALDRAGVNRVQILGADEIPPDASERCIVIRADHFYDERLVAGLCEARDVALSNEPSESGPPEPLACAVPGSGLGGAVDWLRNASAGDHGDPPAALRAVTPLDLAPAYNPTLRKFDPPFAVRARAEDLRQVENRIFAASYKGITDFVTKWLFPLPARAVTRWLARRSVKPNTVTLWSYGLVALAIWLFAFGWFATGLVVAWVMTFLDTVDGKLARVTLTSSRLGGVLDHGLDLVHPPIWWAAWGWGLAHVDGVSSGLGPHAAATWIVVGGYFAGRLLEGVFLAVFKQEIFCWQRFDGLFRTVIARRNPNLVLLSAGVLAGSAELGFEAVALWTLICLAIPTARIFQAFALKRRGGVVRPWNEAPPETSV